MPTPCWGGVGVKSCACPQRAAARCRCNMSVVHLYLTFGLSTVEGQEECQALGPCELYLSDTFFCVHKEVRRSFLWIISQRYRFLLLEIQIAVYIWKAERKEGDNLCSYLLQYKVLVYVGTDILIHSWAITYVSPERFF